LPSGDPLNGGFLIVNMHGMLFHPLTSDIAEDVAYARWLGSGVIRVFATDNNGLRDWDGVRVGNRIADIAPTLRATQMQLIVALVNNHRQVPDELPAASGWMDNYWQLLLPFYTDDWRGAYLTFVRELISTVQARGAGDVIYAWELGNELHTPVRPDALMPFITQATAQVRALDPSTPILPGTMGANHVEPGNKQSSIARWLYCDAPIDAYTLHAYDWVSRDRPGDMPIDWDLDQITAQPCPDGRTLPVIVEELGTSRALAGMYTADDEAGRLQQEARQIEFIRQFRQVIGFGIWNGESPRLVDRTFVDTRRGMTSYGSHALGGGSCYDPTPDPAPGVRCQLEQAIRGIHFVRVDTADQWLPGLGADQSNPPVGSVDPVSKDAQRDAVAITGTLTGPSSSDTDAAVTTLGLFLGDTPSLDGLLASAEITAPSAASPGQEAPAASANGRFTLNVPFSRLSAGPNLLTLTASSPANGTWSTTLQVVVPKLGPAVPIVLPSPPLAPLAPSAPSAPAPSVPSAPVPVLVHAASMDVMAPAPDAEVPRHFLVDVLAPGADRIDVFLDPGRDRGGRLAGSLSTSALLGLSGASSAFSSGAFHVPVTAGAGPQSIYVHAHYPAAAEQMVTVPIKVVD
jgi:hypothetical protein